MFSHLEACNFFCYFSKSLRFIMLFSLLGPKQLCLILRQTHTIRLIINIMGYFYCFYFRLLISNKIIKSRSDVKKRVCGFL